jgi:hypothetical protein
MNSANNTKPRRLRGRRRGYGAGADVRARLAHLSDDDLVARWHGIIEVVRKELTRLNLQRQFMQEATDVMNGNPRFLAHRGRRLMDYTRDWYGTAMAIAYRRQTDSSPESASLRVLLDEMTVRPDAYRVDTLRPHMGRASDDVIEDMVVRTVVRKGSSQIDLAVLRKDYADLAQVGKNVRNFVNKHVAHTDIAANQNPIETTFDEIHSAAVTCERIASRWVTALTGPAYSFDVTKQYGWHEVFDFPWRASMPNDEPGTKRYILAVHPCLNEDEEDAWFEGRGPDERQAIRVKQLLHILAEARSLEPYERRGGFTAIPNIVSVERLL